MKIDAKKNTIVCGDNLQWIQDIPDNSIDLVYIDPPFFTTKNWEVIWGNGFEKRSFQDRFSGGRWHYVEWLKDRILLLKSKIKNDGAIVVHCDWHANHRIRCVLDEVFDENIVNEIYWKRIHTVKGNHGQNKAGLDPNVDTIYYYSKSKDYFFKQPFSEYSEEYLEKSYNNVDPDGRRYQLVSMNGPGGASKGNPKYEVMGVERYWRYSKETMDELIGQGLVVQKKPGSVPRKKQYLDQGKGVAIQTLWDDIHFRKHENLEYPTQKPLDLIKRIIEMATEKGDVVLDCFGGGGTTALACAESGRTFITGDVSPVAVKIMAERILFESPKTKFELLNVPKSEEELKKMNGHQFADTVCELMGWKVNEKKTGDGGIDGWADSGKLPIQIKNQIASTGRPDIQKFVGAVGKSKKGIFVSWSFSKEAKDYAAKTKSEQGIEIVLYECKTVFGGLLLTHEKTKEIELLYLEKRPKNWASNLAKALAHKEVMAKIAKAASKPKKIKKIEVNETK